MRFAIISAFLSLSAAQGAVTFSVFDGVNQQIQNTPALLVLPPFTDPATPFGSAAAIAIASWGGVGAAATVNFPYDPSLPYINAYYSLGHAALAQIEIDSLFYSGSTPVTVSANLLLSGAMALLGAGAGPDDFEHAYVYASIALNGVDSVGVYQISTNPIYNQNAGILAGLTGTSFTNVAVQSGPLTLQPGLNTLKLALVAQAYTASIPAPTGTGAGGWQSAAYFQHTLGFTTDGPLFDGLPDGATVSAPEFGINNNLFTPIPEAGTLWMCAAGLLIACRRRLPMWKR